MTLRRGLLRRSVCGLLLGVVPLAACAGGTSLWNAPMAKVEVVRSFPHQSDAFTQGLVFSTGELLESTGLVGRSSLRRVELATGKVLRKVDVAAPYFAEGLTLRGGKLYQLTWLEGKGFIYDAVTLAKTGEFHYTGEGWGLTTDGDSLILSDGTADLRFLDPQTFAVRRRVTVRDGSRSVDQLNELEYVRGEVWANVWHTDWIVRIDPATGNVIGVLDARALLPSRGSSEDVLNGIAFDPATDRVFVTGKLWPTLYELKLPAALRSQKK